MTARFRCWRSGASLRWTPRSFVLAIPFLDLVDECVLVVVPRVESSWALLVPLPERLVHGCGERVRRKPR